MGTLSDRYRSARKRAGREGKELLADGSSLERELFDLHVRGRRAHPGIVLSESAFASHLGRCGAVIDGAADAVEAADLFLAAAALAADPSAITALTGRCGPAALRYLGRLGVPAPDLDDLAQELWTTLLVGLDGAPPKLATYSGRGPLAAFARIAAQRIALMRFRKSETAARISLRAAVESSQLAQDPELSWLKERYRSVVQEAIGQALKGLNDRARTVLRMNIVDRVSIESIARAYQVQQSTVSRWMERARRQVAEETRRWLTEHMGVSDQDSDSICRLVIGQLDLDVSRALGSCQDRNGRARE